MSKGKSHISSKKSNRCDFLFKFVNRNQPGLSMKWETQCAHRSVRTSAPPCTGIFAFLHFVLLCSHFCILLRRHFCISALCIVAQDFLNFCTGIFAFLHFALLHRHFRIFAQEFLHLCIFTLEFLHLRIFAQAFLHFRIFARCIVAQEFLHFLHFVLLLRYFCT